jgi:hypothetical protein
MRVSPLAGQERLQKVDDIATQTSHLFEKTTRPTLFHSKIDHMVGRRILVSTANKTPCEIRTGLGNIRTHAARTYGSFKKADSVICPWKSIATQAAKKTRNDTILLENGLALTSTRHWQLGCGGGRTRYDTAIA